MGRRSGKESESKEGGARLGVGSVLPHFFSMFLRACVLCVRIQSYQRKVGLKVMGLVKK